MAHISVTVPDDPAYLRMATIFLDACATEAKGRGIAPVSPPQPMPPTNPQLSEISGGALRGVQELLPGAPDLDIEGLEWDSEQHSTPAKKNADGTWRKKRAQTAPAQPPVSPPAAVSPPVTEAPAGPLTVESLRAQVTNWISTGKLHPQDFTTTLSSNGLTNFMEAADKPELLEKLYADFEALTHARQGE